MQANPPQPAEIAATPAPALVSGTLIAARYLVDAAAGESIFGALYRCRDNRSNRPVALRALRAALFPDAQFERLRADVRAATALDQRNIVATYGLGRDGAIRYVAIEPVGDAQTLRDLFERKWKEARNLSLKGAINLAVHLCTALEYAHGTTVHGGLTPSSVLVDRAGRVKIADFGLARAIGGRPPAGAKPFDAVELKCLAPELDDGGDALTQRSDVFGVGALLYLALCGKAPSSPPEPARGVVPDLPADIDEILAHCLARDPDQRFAAVAALRNAVRSLLPEEAEPTPEPPPASKGPMIVSSVAAPHSPAPMPIGAARAAAPPPTPPGASPSGRPPPPPPPTGPRAPAAAARAPLMQRSSGRFAIGSLLGSEPAEGGDERWLVQRDRLDFGPFGMEELKRLIRTGEFAGEHTIVDQTTGERARVKKHPLLRAFVEEVEAERERKRRDEADRATHVAEKRGRRAVWTITGGLGAVLALGVWLFVSKAKEGDKGGPRQRVTDIEGQLRSIDISWKPRPKGARTGGRRRGGGGARAPGAGPGGPDEFDAPLELGNVDEGGGDETLDQGVIQDVMTRNFGLIKGCALEEKRRNSGTREIEIEFIVKGDGRVSAVRANGAKSGPLHACILGQMKKIPFPRYNGQRTVAGFSMRLK